MRKSDFNFVLPPALIAQHPVTPRSASRLLILQRGSGAVHDAQFGELADRLAPGDMLVFNDTRVIPARLFGTKASGGRIEMLIERIVDDTQILAQVRPAKSLKPAQRIALDARACVHAVERRGEFWVLRVEADEPLPAVLERLGHVPLPPYIARTDAPPDSARYQTVFARHAGAVAAPTAGLHFDAAVFTALAARGVATGFITLHVGAGTFAPLRVDDVAQHRMHRERVIIDADTAAAINATRARGGRVFAVGTTVVRALETASRETADGSLGAFHGETEIFIVPGYRFRAIDGLITNFHLPESTLLMLVCAFAGREATLAAYAHAVTQKYRFYSYGDAMLIMD